MPKKSIKELQKKHKQSNKIMKPPFEEFRCGKCKNKIKELSNGEYNGKIIVLFYDKEETKKDFYDLLKDSSQNIRDILIVHNNTVDCDLKHDLSKSYPPGLSVIYSFQENLSKLTTEETISFIKNIRDKTTVNGRSTVTNTVCRLNVPYYEEAIRHIPLFYRSYRGQQFDRFYKPNLEGLDYFLHCIYTHGENY